MPTSKELPTMLIKSLKLEYESTQITRSELLNKYSLDESQVPFSDWSKEGQITVLPATSPKENKPSTNEEDTEDSTDSASELKDSINSTAKALVSKMNTILVEDIDVSPKDIKEMAAALVSIKESTIGKDPTTVVNIDNSSIQNNLIQIANAIKSLPKDC